LVVSIYSDALGLPGDPLGAVVLAASDIGVDERSEIRAVFDAPVPVEAGRSWIVLSTVYAEYRQGFEIGAWVVPDGPSTGLTAYIDYGAPWLDPAKGQRVPFEVVGKASVAP
jgi:hypothetical protein